MLELDNRWYAETKMFVVLGIPAVVSDNNDFTNGTQNCVKTNHAEVKG